MDIETLAVERPEALARVPVDPVVGIDQAKAEEIVAARRGSTGDPTPGRDRPGAAAALGGLPRPRTPRLVEVNPLVKTGNGAIVALDGKVSLDANADFRQPGHEALADKSAEDPLEAAAKAKDLNYVKLDASVGIIGNGAGLVMSTLDVVAYAGEDRRHRAGVRPACGGAERDRVGGLVRARSRVRLSGRARSSRRPGPSCGLLPALPLLGALPGEGPGAISQLWWLATRRRCRGGGRDGRGARPAGGAGRRGEPGRLGRPACWPGWCSPAGRPG